MIDPADTVGVAEILEALRKVLDPELGRDIVSLGFIKDLAIQDGLVSFKIELTTPACPLREQIKSQADAAALSVPGVKRADITLTARTSAGLAPRKESLAGQALPGVSHIIAVASGKGGVGKSTVSVNLAVGLAAAGAKVGILDADVYGPSVPKMMGLQSSHLRAKGGRLQPPEQFGVKVMSLGLMIEEKSALIWRGPLLARAVGQMLRDVDWGELDYLIVDLPPGTGDVPLTLAQLVPVSGVVVVATPQEVALRIAAKAAAMFQRLEVPVLGVVENMSTFICPHCGKETPIFNHAGKDTAKALSIEPLGSIPLDSVIVADGDEGSPTIAVHPESPQAEAFRKMASAVAARMSVVTRSEADRLKALGQIP